MPFPKVPEDCVAVCAKIAEPVEQKVDVLLTCIQSTDLESLTVVSIDASRIKTNDIKIVDDTNVEISVTIRIDFTFDGQSRSYPFKNAKASCQTTHNFRVGFAPSSELLPEECSASLSCSTEPTDWEFDQGILTINTSVVGTVTCVECKPEIVIVKKGT